MLGSGQGCSWGTGECVSGAWGCFGVFSGVLGLFEGVGGLRGVSGSLLPSFPFNVRKSQMRILNFFSRPEDPKCLKYQNVPNLGSFWAIGKPWERFQSWDIRIYFIPVPKDHTVAGLPQSQLSILECVQFTWNFGSRPKVWIYGGSRIAKQKPHRKLIVACVWSTQACVCWR